jgi:hypothetical protein
VSKPKRRRTGLPPAPSCANVPASHAGTIGNRKAGLAAAAMSPDVKVFGCRPHDGGAAHTGAGVRKPPMEETAGRDTSGGAA